MLKHPDGRVEYPYEETGKTRHCTSIEMLVELLTEKVCSSACVMLCRKSLFSSVRFPVGRYFEDHAVTYLLVNAAKNGCVHIGKSYYHYWQRTASICHTLDFKKIYDYLSANFERIKFIYNYPEFTPDDRKKLLRFNVKLYIGNMIIAINLASCAEDWERLRDMKNAVYSVVSRNDVSGKEWSRLLRMRWFWRIFVKTHMQKKQ